MILTHKGRRIRIPKIIRTKPRTEGLAICVTSIYWYIDFVRLIEWVEVWRKQGATKFYLYYEEVSREVYEVFKIYEEMGILVPIPAENLPKNKETGYDPDKFMYQTGDMMLQNDCVMRSTEKYAARIDLDEIFMVQGNMTVYELFESEKKKDPTVGGFGFDHQALFFDPKLMPHLKTTSADFDYKKPDFQWVKSAIITNKFWAMGKAVSMPDHVSKISIHYIVAMQEGFKAIGIPHSKAVYYHERSSYMSAAMAGELDVAKKDNKSKDYEPRLQAFFTDEMVKTIKTAYDDIMKRVENAMGRPPKLYNEIFKIIKKCIGPIRSYAHCSTKLLCINELANFTEWVYASPNEYESKYLIPL